MNSSCMRTNVHYLILLTNSSASSFGTFFFFAKYTPCWRHYLQLFVGLLVWWVVSVCGLRNRFYGSNKHCSSSSKTKFRFSWSYMPSLLTFKETRSIFAKHFYAAVDKYHPRTNCSLKKFVRSLCSIERTVWGIILLFLRTGLSVLFSGWSRSKHSSNQLPLRSLCWQVSSPILLLIKKVPKWKWQ